MSLDKLLGMAGQGIGTIISTVSIIVALVAGWNDMQSSVAINAQQIAEQKHLIQRNTRQVEALRNEIKAEMQRITAMLHEQNDRDTQQHYPFLRPRKHNHWD